MQLGTSTIPLLPAVAVGVAVVLGGLVLWGVFRVRRASDATPALARTGGHEQPEPGPRDWTGEAAGGAADPPPPARPRTVADAVAARGADTEPIAAVPAEPPPAAWGAAAPGSDLPAAAEPAGTPVAVVSGPGASTRTASAWSAFGSGGSPAETPGSGGSPAETSGSGGSAVEASGSGGSPVEVSEPGASTGETADPPGTDDPPKHDDTTASAPAGRAPDDPSAHAGCDDTAPEEPDAHRRGVVPDLDEDADAPAVGTGPVPPPWSPARIASAGTREGTGSSEPVSFAVRQALAARAVQRARGRPDVPDLAADDVPPALPDARDRLLAVLLSDPVTALGATTEVDDARARIDQLGDVLRRRRADLATAVHRLHASGLTGEQIGRLSGLDGDDVREILEQPSGEGSSGR